MNETSDRGNRRDDFSRSRGGFLAKTNPNVGDRVGERSGAGKIGPRAEFQARTSPEHGRAPLTEAQKELAKQYMPLARALAGQLHAKRRVERDEIESVAFVALVEAARCYDADSDAHFATYARYRIVGAILDFSRKAGMGRHLQSSTMIGPWGVEMEAEQYGRPVWFTPDLPIGTEFDAADAVEHHLRPMTSVQAKACRLIYLEGKTQEEAAEVMECTPTYISKIHREAIEMLFERSRGRRDLQHVSDSPDAEEAGSRGRDAYCRPSPLRARTRMPKPRLMATAC